MPGDKHELAARLRASWGFELTFTAGKINGEQDVNIILGVCELLLHLSLTSQNDGADVLSLYSKLHSQSVVHFAFRGWMLHRAVLLDCRPHPRLVQNRHHRFQATVVSLVQQEVRLVLVSVRVAVKARAALQRKDSVPTIQLIFKLVSAPM